MSLWIFQLVNTTEVSVIENGAFQTTKLSVQNSRSSSVLVSRAKIKSVKLTLVIIICYILSSCPFIVGQLIFQLSQDEM